MGIKEQVERRKAELLSDPTVCEANRKLMREFFEYEEYKLLRQNGLSKLDDACYKTLATYLNRFRNVNTWFKNKPWKNLTRADIKRVYDGLEDRRILNRAGKPFGDRSSYYNKIFKSKPFKMAGKDKIARDVMAFYQDRSKIVVRFLDEANFRKLVSVLSQPNHLLLFWLAWDIGENINSLLKLQKRDFTRQQDAATGETEYLVHLPKDKLKRSRRERTEPTMYAQTVQYADIVLASLGEDDYLFDFGHRQALKILRGAGDRSGAVSLPKRDKIMWKDFRSGMACHLLNQGCSTDEVNFRLGHKPSSRVIDVYISYFAIDSRRPKKKVHETNLHKIQSELADMQQREKLAMQRARHQVEENDVLRRELERTRDDVAELRRMLKSALGANWPG